MLIIKKLFLLFTIVFTAWAQQKNGQELASMSVNLYENQNSKYLSVSLENEKKWHTYWINPGDAGLPTEIDILINDEKVDLAPKEWPTPKKYLEAGNLLTIGYGAVSYTHLTLPTIE